MKYKLTVQYQSLSAEISLPESGDEDAVGAACTEQKLKELFDCAASTDTDLKIDDLVLMLNCGELPEKLSVSLDSQQFELEPGAVVEHGDYKLTLTSDPEPGLELESESGAIAIVEDEINEIEEINDDEDNEKATKIDDGEEADNKADAPKPEADITPVDSAEAESLESENESLAEDSLEVVEVAGDEVAGDENYVEADSSEVGNADLEAADSVESETTEDSADGAAVAYEIEAPEESQVGGEEADDQEAEPEQVASADDDSDDNAESEESEEQADAVEPIAEDSIVVDSLKSDSIELVESENPVASEDPVESTTASATVEVSVEVSDEAPAETEVKQDLKSEDTAEFDEASDASELPTQEIEVALVKSEAQPATTDQRKSRSSAKSEVSATPTREKKQSRSTAPKSVKPKAAKANSSAPTVPHQAGVVGGVVEDIDEDIVDLSSMAIRTEKPESNPIGWILLVGVVVVSGFLTWASLNDRAVTKARTQYEKILDDFDAGAFSMVQSKIHRLLGEVPDHRFKARLLELKARAAIMESCGELQADFHQIDQETIEFLKAYPETDWSRRALSATIKGVAEQFINTLESEVATADSASGLGKLETEFEALRERLDEKPAWAVSTHLRDLNVQLNQLEQSIKKRAEFLTNRVTVERVADSVEKLLDQRNVVEARRLMAVNAQRNPEWTKSALWREKQDAVHTLEQTILRFRTKLRPKFEATTDIIAKYYRPLTRQRQKTLKPLVDQETPAFLVGDGFLTALHPRTATALWSRPSSLRQPPALVLLETRDVYVNWTVQGDIEVLLTEGRLVGRGKVAGPIRFEPVVVGSKLYVIDRDGVVRVFDLETGQWLGSHLPSARIVAPLGVDSGQARVPVILEHDMIAILSPESDKLPVLFESPVSANEIKVAPLLSYNHLLLIANKSSGEAELIHLQATASGFSLKSRYSLAAWVQRPMAFANGRVMISTIEGHLYPFSLNTADDSAGLTPLYETRATPRSQPDETLLVTQFAPPNFLYVGGQRIERKVISVKTGWWTLERRYQPRRDFQKFGIVDKQFQLHEARIFISSLRPDAQKRLLTAVTMEGDPEWQVTLGLPHRAAIQSVAGQVYLSQKNGSLFALAAADDSSPVAVIDPLICPEEIARNSAVKPALIKLGDHVHGIVHSNQNEVSCWQLQFDSKPQPNPSPSSIETLRSSPVRRRWRISSIKPTLPIVASDRFCVVTSASKVTVLNVRSGERVGQQIDFRSKVTLPPVVVGQKLIVACEDGLIRVLEVDTQARKVNEIARLGQKGSAFSSIAATKTRILFVQNGTLGAYRLVSGVYQQEFQSEDSQFHGISLQTSDNAGENTDGNLVVWGERDFACFKLSSAGLKSISQVKLADDWPDLIGVGAFGRELMLVTRAGYAIRPIRQLESSETNTKLTSDGVPGRIMSSHVAQDGTVFLVLESFAVVKLKQKLKSS